MCVHISGIMVCVSLVHTTIPGGNPPSNTFNQETGFSSRMAWVQDPGSQSQCCSWSRHLPTLSLNSRIYLLDQSASSGEEGTSKPPTCLQLVEIRWSVFSFPSLLPWQEAAGLDPLEMALFILTKDCQRLLSPLDLY